MNRRAFPYVLFCLALCASSAIPSEPGEPVSPAALTAPISEVQATQPEKAKQEEKKAPEMTLPEAKLPADIFDPALLPSSEASTGFTPQMIGDFAAYYSLQRINVVGTQTTTATTTKSAIVGENIVTTTTTTTSSQNFTTTRLVRVPITSLGAFNIAEDESPRPQDRVFFTYNNFNGLQGPGTPGMNVPIVGGQTSSTTVSNPIYFLPPTTTTTTASTRIPGVTTPEVNLNREVFGFEKTFLDGRASIEMRLPLLQQQSAADLGGFSEIGDLTIIGKYAIFMDNTTGNLLSAGMAITCPTGATIPVIDGDAIHSTLFQPFFGYVWNFDRFFIQAFHSIVVPSDPRDVTMMFNDVGADFWLYRGPTEGILTYIVPTVEVHVTTPLNHRSSDDPLFVPDFVAITGGVHIGLGRNTTLTLGVVNPVTGPRVFNIEGLAQLNWRF